MLCDSMSEYGLIVENGRSPGTYFYHVGDGFHYNYHKDSSNTIYFRCQKFWCSGRALLKFGTGFQHTQPHNHAADILYPEVRAAQNEILMQASSMNYLSFNEIIRMEKRRIPNEAVRSRLTLRNLRSAMQRARADVYPRIPASLYDLTCILQDPEWESLTSTLDFQDSIYLGSAVASDYSINVVFMSSRCLEILRVCDTVFADGTFFVAPAIEGCYQVFTLVTVHGHTVIPLCWCLMQCKSQAAYESVLGLIRAHLGDWNFTKVVGDFEDAMINSFRTVFGIETQGCLFHASDAMARQAKATIGLHLIHHYAEVDIIIRLCCALPLLPARFLQRGLNAIGAASMNQGEHLYGIVRPFLAYVQHDWLDHPNRGVAMSVCGSSHRTNNGSESNNRRMRRRFGVHHPNVYHFIRSVALFESETCDDLASLQRGLIPTRHRDVVAVSNDAVIIRITNELMRDPDPSEQTLIDFLSAASLCIQGHITDVLR